MDGVTLALLTKRFERIVNRMHNTLLRTARSGVINSGRDFSCCIVTADNQLLVTGESLPIHVMVGADMMARSMCELHPVLRRGDAYLHNSPYHGCSHPADQTVLVPVFDEAGVHRYTVLAKAHQADIGNSVATTYFATARDVYEEGALIFPAVKVQEDYEYVEDIIRLSMMRIRAPEMWRGDLLAAVGAARIGERELLSLGEETGWDRLDDYRHAWFDYSEQRMAAAIRQLPDGSANATCTHDPFPGTPPEGVAVTVKVTVESDGPSIEVDLRDNPDCMPCGLNLSESCARSAAMIGLFNALGDASVPTNQGSFRRVRILLRENCIVGIPRHPTSCSAATTNLAERLTGAVQLAMAQFGDEFGMAEAGVGLSAGQAVISGNDPRKAGAPYVNQVILGDTLGAAAAQEDGWLTLLSVVSAGVCLFDSVEVDEIQYPLRVRQRRLVPNSEGAGTFRSAPSSLVEFGPIDCTMRVVFGSDGRVNRPQGVRGGLAGGPASNSIENHNGDTSVLPAWVDVTLNPGEHVTGISCAGGGYGSPLRRDTLRVKRDVDEGWVTRDRAREVYGVVFTARGIVDDEATQSLRSHALSRGLDK